MSVDRQRWRWSVASALTLVTVFLLLVLNESWWERIGVFHMRPYFADTVAILAAGEAQRAGLDVYQPNPFDPLGRPHVYGPAWLAIAGLGLMTEDAWWLGALLALTTVGVALWLLAPRNLADALGVCLLILSPPVLLGLERGNNDLVVFLLLALAAVCLARPSTLGGFAGTGVLVLAGVLKFYPLAALATVLARRERVVRLVWIVAGALALFGALWWVQRVEFFRVLAITPRPDSIYAYGIRILSVAWAHEGEGRLWFVAGVALGGLGAAAALWRGRAAIARSIPDEGLLAAAAVAGGTSWLFCFLANNNYSYRAILWLLVVPAWLALARSAEAAPRALGRGLCRLLLVALWAFMPKSFTIELLRADGGVSLERWRWVLLSSGIEQALILVLSTVLMVALVAWAWRRGRTLLQLG